VEPSSLYAESSAVAVEVKNRQFRKGEQTMDICLSHTGNSLLRESARSVLRVSIGNDVLDIPLVVEGQKG